MYSEYSPERLEYLSVDATVWILGVMVPDCQTGTEKTADTFDGAKMEKKMGS